MSGDTIYVPDRYSEVPANPLLRSQQFRISGLPLECGSFYPTSAKHVSTISYHTKNGSSVQGRNIDGVVVSKPTRQRAEWRGRVSSSMQAVRRSLQSQKGAAYDHLVRLEALTREESTWWPEHWRQKKERHANALSRSGRNDYPLSGTPQSARVELTCSQSVEEWAKVKSAGIARERASRREQIVKEQAHAVARKEAAENAWAKWVKRKENEARAKAVRSRREQKEAERKKKEEEEAAERQRARDQRFYEEKRIARLRACRAKVQQRQSETKADSEPQANAKTSNAVPVKGGGPGQRASRAHRQWLRKKRKQERSQRRQRQKILQLQAAVKAEERRLKWSKKSVVCACKFACVDIASKIGLLHCVAVLLHHHDLRPSSISQRSERLTILQLLMDYFCH